VKGGEKGGEESVGGGKGRKGGWRSKGKWERRQERKQEGS